MQSRSAARAPFELASLALASLALAVCALAVGAQTPDPPPPSEASPARGAAIADELGGAGLPGSERVEHFRFESADGQPLGRALWRRRAGPRGLQLERQMRFAAPDEPDGEVGLSQVECLEPDLTRLVHREVGRGGRVVLAEWTRERDGLRAQRDGLRAFEWSSCGVRREVLATDASAALPLYLCELARDGRLTAGRIGCFDPMAQAIVALEVRTLYATDAPAGAPPSAARTVELRRGDGTLFLRLCFSGAELTAFQLQEGGPWARRAAAPAPDADGPTPSRGTAPG